MDKDITFQVYRQPITNIFPKQFISLDQFLEYTRNPPHRIVNVFAQIATAEETGNKELKAELKQTHLLYFTPCVEVNPKRNYESIVRFTSLLVLDFDHIGNAQEFKEYLFNQYPAIIAAWLSPSKHGVKALVQIPIVETVEAFKQYYFGIAAEMEQYNGFDPSGQNSVLPLFQSYDPELLYRDDPDTWQVKGSKRNDFTASPVKPRPNINHSDRDKETIVKMINSGFAHVCDYGHPPLRSLCIAIGGYIAAGYIDEGEAMQYINYGIETHPYLKKGISGYKKTAQWAIRIGQQKPLSLNFQRNG
jgi:hypothetical protein